MKKPSINRITNNIFCIDLPLNGKDIYTRSFIIKGEYTILIDTGIRDSANDIVEAFEMANISMGNLKFIFNTHGHFDHIGSNFTLKQFSGGMIAASANAAKWIEDFDLQYKECYNRFPDIIEPSPDYKIDFYNKVGSPGNVDLKFSGDLTLNLGDKLLINVLATPGHTGGDISFYEEKTKTLICGDALCGEGDFDLHPLFCYPKDYKKSVSKLEKLKVKNLLTSHYPIVKENEVKKFFESTKDYYNYVEKTVTELNKKHSGDLLKISKNLCKKLKKKFTVQSVCVVNGFLK